MSPNEPARSRHPFRVLVWLSASRLVDIESLGPRGDLQGMMARWAGLAITLGGMLAGILVPPYFRDNLSHQFKVVQMRNDEEFLLSLTVAVSGLFSVFVWNSVLPDRRDCLVLGTLPLRPASIAGSRLLTLLGCLATVVAMVDALAGCTLPLALANGAGEKVASLLGWWAVVMGAALFPFGCALALQSVASQVLPWNTFLRVSGQLQLAVLCVVLVLLFLTPPFGATVAQPSLLISFLPSYWFEGVREYLRGIRTPGINQLAWWAVRNLLVAMGIAGLGFVLGWVRNFRRILESPDIAPRHSPLLAQIPAFIVGLIIRHPVERAVALFSLRTTMRSFQHRLFLAMYVGAGLALAIAFSKSLFFGRRATAVAWAEPNAPFLITAGLLILCCISGARGIFTLPHTLDANWIFRVTLVQRPGCYFRAVRKSLFLIAVLPPLLASMVFFFAVWPWGFALRASITLLIFGSVAAERSIRHFRKVPFACSWLPSDGQSVSTVRALAIAIGTVLMASILGNIGLWVLGDSVRFYVLAGFLLLALRHVRRDNHEFADAEGMAVQFEHVPPSEIFALDLRPDGEWLSDEAQVNALNA